jgi:hypothetical protein
MKWIPKEFWKDEDVLIIGGGPSIKDLPWNLLWPEHTIGCNTAFTLGIESCEICVFGDMAWWKVFKDDLEKYEGMVFTNILEFHTECNHFKCPPWVWTMERRVNGLHRDALGWNGNTGSVAINLALIAGAKNIYLLGFDMKRINNKPNWHDRIIRPEATKPDVYKMFTHQFKFVSRDWRLKFPDRKIFNVTRDSGLDQKIFPWIDPDVFWASRKVA